jgi:hypothetical protein
VKFLKAVITVLNPEGAGIWKGGRVSKGEVTSTPGEDRVKRRGGKKQLKCLQSHIACIC